EVGCAFPGSLLPCSAAGGEPDRVRTGVAPGCGNGCRSCGSQTGSASGLTSRRHPIFCLDSLADLRGTLVAFPLTPTYLLLDVMTASILSLTPVAASGRAGPTPLPSADVSPGTERTRQTVDRRTIPLVCSAERGSARTRRSRSVALVCHGL